MNKFMKIFSYVVVAIFASVSLAACTVKSNNNVVSETTLQETTETLLQETTETNTETENTEIKNTETETVEVITDTIETETATSTIVNEENKQMEDQTTQSVIASTSKTQPAQAVKNNEEAETENHILYAKNAKPIEDRAMGAENKNEEDTAQEGETVLTEENFITEDSDYILLCNVVAHEAGSDWISTEDKAKVAEVVLNRVNSESYPDDIYSVITQKGQFSGCQSYANLDGYSSKVSEDVKAAVDIVLSSEYENHGYTGFWGDGKQNHFH